MTIGAILGLLGANLGVAVVGAAVLWGLGGWRWWTELARLAGLAYLLGVASFVTLVSLALVAGVPFGGATVVLAGVALLAAGLLAGMAAGRARPQLRPPGWSAPRPSIVAALLLAALGVYFEALFRSARLMPLSEWDAWWCWTLRAKAIYYFEGLDSSLFGAGAPRCPGYPPGLSAVQAAGFHAMGSVDVVTMHLQYWLLAAGFAAAVAGLLAPRVRPAILLPFLLLVLLLPSYTARVTDGRADLPLAYLFVAGAVLVLLWLEDRRPWRLPTAAVLFAGGLLMKREGLLLLAVVLVAGIAASWRDARSAWPRLAACGAAAVILSLPWRLWLAAEGAPTGAPPTGYFGLADYADRAWPALLLVVRTFFDYELWLLLPALALVAGILAFVSGGRPVATFLGAFVAASIAGCTWAIWSEPNLEITQDYGLNPVVRLVGGPILALGAFAPLALERAWAQGATELRAPGTTARSRSSRLSWALIVAAVAAYPASMLVGYSGFRLPGGSPSFPSAADCEVAPRSGDPVRVVFGYRRSYDDAFTLERRARGAGFGRTQVRQDGCGRLRVFVGDLAPDAAARIVDEAALAGLRPAVERDPDAMRGLTGGAR